MSRFVTNLASYFAMPQAIDFWLKQFNVNYSLTSPTAKVVTKEIVGDAVRLVLKPSRRFGEFVAGQHIRLKMPVGAINLERCYSIANLPNSENLVELYVKAQGVVSKAIRSQLNVGQVVEVSQPFGQNLKQGFSTFVAGGIGITAMWPLFKARALETGNAQLFYLHRQGSEQTKSSDDDFNSVPLLDEIKQSKWYKKGLITILDGRTALNDAKSFIEKFGADAKALTCGSPSFNEAVSSAVRTLREDVTLHIENFATQLSVKTSPEKVEKNIKVRMLNSNDEVEITNQETVLDGLLAAGKKVRFGCKQGICQECTCTVSNESAANGNSKQIQLCMTYANEDLELMI